MVASSPLPTIVSRSSVRARTRGNRAFGLVLPLAILFSLTATSVQAHQPVRLTKQASNVAASPILLDATISFAVYADFTSEETKDRKRGATRHLRFTHRAGDSLAVQYLIPDTAQMRTMRASQLPKVTITSPSGKVIQLRVNERTRFSKPYLPQDYFYLSRISRVAEAGTYTATITSQRAASALVAVGYQEVPGEVLEFGTSTGLCPLPVAKSATPLEPIKDEVARQLIGMKEEAAKVCAESNSWGYRVGMRDGEFFALTRDYRIDRITVSIQAGLITEVQVG